MLLKTFKKTALVAAALLTGTVNVALATELRSHSLVDFWW